MQVRITTLTQSIVDDGRRTPVSLTNPISNKTRPAEMECAVDPRARRVRPYLWRLIVAPPFGSHRFCSAGADETSSLVTEY